MTEIKTLPFRLYGQMECPHCAAAQAFLTTSGVPIQTVPVLNDPVIVAGLKEAIGNVVFPVLVSLWTKDIVVGFKPEEYERLIKLFHASNSPSAPDKTPDESVDPSEVAGKPQVETVSRAN